MNKPNLTPEQVEKNKAVVNNSVAELAERCNYLNVTNPFRGEGSHGHTTLLALSIAREINEILVPLPGATDNHQASVSITQGALAIFIGGECVYDSECHTPDEEKGESLTASWCIEQYKAAIWANVRPFVEILRKEDRCPECPPVGCGNARPCEGT